MGAILLGSAGNNPNTVSETPSIPIPSVLPNDPAVVTEEPNLARTNLEGIPSGGNLGDVLAKRSASDYDLEWKRNSKEVVPESLVINRVDDVVVSIVKGTKTITITRNIDGEITSIYDGTYTQTIVREDGIIIGINVT